MALTKIKLTRTGNSVVVDGHDITESVQALGVEATHDSFRLAIYLRGEIELEGEGIVELLPVGAEDATIAFLESVDPQQVSKLALERLGMGGSEDDPIASAIHVLKEMVEHARS